MRRQNGSRPRVRSRLRQCWECQMRKPGLRAASGIRRRLGLRGQCSHGRKALRVDPSRPYPTSISGVRWIAVRPQTCPCPVPCPDEPADGARVGAARGSKRQRVARYRPGIVGRRAVCQHHWPPSASSWNWRKTTEPQRSENVWAGGVVGVEDPALAAAASLAGNT